jgi:hypothetical protein
MQSLLAGAGSSSQFIGGLVVALLYVYIGLFAAIGSIFVFRRIFRGRWEQIFLLSCRNCRLLSELRCHFGASIHAWQTELVGVAVFLVCAVGGLFSRSAIALFCSTFDFVVACYLMASGTAWHEAGKFDPFFWRSRS